MSDSGAVKVDVTFSADYWVTRLRIALDSRLAMLRVILSTLDDGSYLERLAPRPQEGIMQLTLGDIAPVEQLAKLARREAVLGDGVDHPLLGESARGRAGGLRPQRVLASVAATSGRLLAAAGPVTAGTLAR